MFFALAMGLWGMVAYVRRQPLGPNYWGALVIGEVVSVLQATLGVIQLLGGGSPARWIHFLYGSLAVVIWPATFGYLRGQRESRTESLTFGLVSLFLFGIAFRALTTG
jgi:hypothetical protein